ncbi:hypothetical protein [Neorhodopirellula pilleata]|uniref:Uncharacterized protein n=1 Tax=Neorhodopirellula pilleata TaxID=2714738 RepID=A0A5C5ZGR4_9BACT|nr:hypothetical protein [Neorhodopirellula pilleata]TWT86348.1 hypothetical protein Pla100_61340 [Neorhodopirellula pilleata]
MRIPSQLHGEPLYRSKRRSGHGRSHTGGDSSGSRGKPPADQSWRRVIRLVVVLALVLVLMREAGKPTAYEVFFPSTPQRVASVVDPTDFSEQTPTSDGERISGGDFQSPKPETSTESRRHVEKALAEDLAKLSDQELTAKLAAWLADVSAPNDREPTQPVPGTEKLESSGEISPDEMTIAMATAIQQELIRRVKDGSVWRAADTPALMATLAMHRPSPRFAELQRFAFGGEVAGVLPLLQQPAVYLGQGVIARGDVVQVQRIDAPTNSFGLTQYWNLWLMPQDASSRPWLVIVAELPVEISGLAGGQPDAGTDHTWSVTTPYPMVNVRGEFIKRLSYQSAAGAELTPVVAGHVESIRSNGNPAVIIPDGTATASHRDPYDGPPVAWVIASAIALGLVFSIWVMWRTSVLNRQLRERRGRKPVILESWLILLGCLMGSGTTSQAQSVMDLLPGFEPSQLGSIASPVKTSANDPIESLDQLTWNARDLAKLIYRFDRLDDEVLKARRSQLGSDFEPNIGDSILIDGTVIETQTLDVPDELVDILEFETMSIVRWQGEQGEPRVVAFRSLPIELQAGDRLRGSGAMIGKQGESLIDIGGRLAWTPAQPTSPAADVLASSGVDLSRLSEIADLDRKPLTSTDSSVFFSMIGVADRVQRVGIDTELLAKIQAMQSQVVVASPIDLLQSPRQFTGQWISLDVETVRVTRVAVESTQRQDEIGAPFYYQIDAIGDLGRVQLKIEVPDGPPVVMENRYPVTVVTATLPEFLLQAQGNDFVTTQTVPIRVEGFFYRLWSYESDFMKSRGGKQFAPLVIGGVIEDRRPTSSDPIGVSLIGKVAAISIIAGIIAVAIFGWVTRRGDRASRKRRLEQN